MTDAIDRIVRFSVEHGGGKVFDGWSEDDIKYYIAFHANRNSLGIVRDGDEIVAIGTALRCKEEDIKHEFDSTPHDPDGDTVLICDVISVRKGAIPVLLVQLLERWPLGQFKFKAYRDNKLRDISPRYIKLLTNKKLWAAHLQSKLETTDRNRTTR